jgi:hypothetical protein
MMNPIVRAAFLAGVFLAGVMTFAVSARAQDGLVATDKSGDDAPASASVDDDTPPPEQAVLDAFVGTWKCKGKAQTERNPEADVTITLTVKKDLGGRWLAVKTEESKSKDNPSPTVSTQVWGWSRERGQLVQNGADNHGGFYDGSSTGWVGDRFVWITDAARNAKRAKLRESFSKEGKDLHLELTIDPSGSGDAYRGYFDGVCKK